MKLAVIGPPKLLKPVREQGLGYHFVLGQELWRDARYYKWYWEAKERGGFLIVDNGAAEPPEERVSIYNIIHAAIELDADEIILPDKLRDASYTLGWSQKKSILELVPPRKRFIVPQGRDWYEWTDCLVELVRWVNPATIGVPKWLEELPGGRVEAVKRIVNFGFHEQCNIHLLGIHSHVYDEPLQIAKEYPWIRGIDTGAPIAFAQNGMSLNDDDHYSLDWKKGALPLRLEQNIYRYHKYLSSVPYLAEREKADEEQRRTTESTRG